MAVVRTAGYTFSCGPCGLFAPLRARRGDALQDEIDHNRQWPEAACPCPVIAERKHHLIGCDAWRRHLAAEASELSSREAQP